MRRFLAMNKNAITKVAIIALILAVITTIVLVSVPLGGRGSDSRLPSDHGNVILSPPIDNPLGKSYEYTIRKQGSTYIAESYYVSTGAYTVAQGLVLNNIMGAIREDADGADSEVLFGQGQTLNVGDDALRFFNNDFMIPWGTVTVSGTITGTGGNTAVVVVEVPNIIFNANATATGAGEAIRFASEGDLTIQSATIANSGSGTAIRNMGEGSLYAIASTLTSNGSAVVVNQLGTAVLDNSTVTNTGSAGFALNNSDIAVITEGSTVTSRGTVATVYSQYSAKLTVGAKSAVIASGIAKVENTGLGSAIQTLSTDSATQILASAQILNNSSFATIQYSGTATLLITGAKVANAGGGASINSTVEGGNITLGGLVQITGEIRIFPSQLGVDVSSTPSRFNPGSAVFNVCVNGTSPQDFGVGSKFVLNGSVFSNNFTLTNTGFIAGKGLGADSVHLVMLVANVETSDYYIVTKANDLYTVSGEYTPGGNRYSLANGITSAKASAELIKSSAGGRDVSIFFGWANLATAFGRDIFEISGSGWGEVTLLGNLAGMVQIGEAKDYNRDTWFSTVGVNVISYANIAYSSSDSPAIRLCVNSTLTILGGAVISSQGYAVGMDSGIDWDTGYNLSEASFLHINGASAVVDGVDGGTVLLEKGTIRYQVYYTYFTMTGGTLTNIEYTYLLEGSHISGGEITSATNGNSYVLFDGSYTISGGKITSHSDYAFRTGWDAYGGDLTAVIDNTGGNLVLDIKGKLLCYGYYEIFNIDTVVGDGIGGARDITLINSKIVANNGDGLRGDGGGFLRAEIINSHIEALYAGLYIDSLVGESIISDSTIISHSYYALAGFYSYGNDAFLTITNSTITSYDSIAVTLAIPFLIEDGTISAPSSGIAFQINDAPATVKNSTITGDIQIWNETSFFTLGGEIILNGSIVLVPQDVGGAGLALDDCFVPMQTYQLHLAGSYGVEYEPGALVVANGGTHISYFEASSIDPPSRVELALSMRPGFENDIVVEGADDSRGFDYIIRADGVFCADTNFRISANNLQEGLNAIRRDARGQSVNITIEGTAGINSWNPSPSATNTRRFENDGSSRWGTIHLYADSYHFTINTTNNYLNTLFVVGTGVHVVSYINASRIHGDQYETQTNNDDLIFDVLEGGRLTIAEGLLINKYADRHTNVIRLAENSTLKAEAIINGGDIFGGFIIGGGTLTMNAGDVSIFYSFSSSSSPQYAINNVHTAISIGSGGTLNIRGGYININQMTGYSVNLLAIGSGDSLASTDDDITISITGGTIDIRQQSTFARLTAIDAGRAGANILIRNAELNITQLCTSSGTATALITRTEATITFDNATIDINQNGASASSVGIASGTNGIFNITDSTVEMTDSTPRLINVQTNTLLTITGSEVLTVSTYQQVSTSYYVIQASNESIVTVIDSLIRSFSGNAIIAQGGSTIRLISGTVQSGTSASARSITDTSSASATNQATIEFNPKALEIKGIMKINSEKLFVIEVEGPDMGQMFLFHIEINGESFVDFSLGSIAVMEGEQYALRFRSSQGFSMAICPFSSAEFPGYGNLILGISLPEIELFYIIRHNTTSGDYRYDVFKTDEEGNEEQIVENKAMEYALADTRVDANGAVAELYFENVNTNIRIDLYNFYDEAWGPIVLRGQVYSTLSTDYTFKISENMQVYMDMDLTSSQSAGGAVQVAGTTALRSTLYIIDGTISYASSGTIIHARTSNVFIIGGRVERLANGSNTASGSVVDISDNTSQFYIEGEDTRIINHQNAGSAENTLATLRLGSTANAVFMGGRILSTGTVNTIYAQGATISLRGGQIINTAEGIAIYNASASVNISGGTISALGGYAYWGATSISYHNSLSGQLSMSGAPKFIGDFSVNSNLLSASTTLNLGNDIIKVYLRGNLADDWTLGTIVMRGGVAHMANFNFIFVNPASDAGSAYFFGAGLGSSANHVVVSHAKMGTQTYEYYYLQVTGGRSMVRGYFADGTWYTIMDTATVSSGALSRTFQFAIPQDAIASPTVDLIFGFNGDPFNLGTQTMSLTSTWTLSGKIVSFTGNIIGNLNSTYSSLVSLNAELSGSYPREILFDAQIHNFGTAPALSVGREGATQAGVSFLGGIVKNTGGGSALQISGVYRSNNGYLTAISDSTEPTVTFSTHRRSYEVHGLHATNLGSGPALGITGVIGERGLGNTSVHYTISGENTVLRSEGGAGIFFSAFHDETAAVETSFTMLGGTVSGLTAGIHITGHTSVHRPLEVNINGGTVFSNNGNAVVIGQYATLTFAVERTDKATSAPVLYSISGYALHFTNYLRDIYIGEEATVYSINSYAIITQGHLYINSSNSAEIPTKIYSVNGVAIAIDGYSLWGSTVHFVDNGGEIVIFSEGGYAIAVSGSGNVRGYGTSTQVTIYSIPSHAIYVYGFGGIHLDSMRASVYIYSELDIPVYLQSTWTNSQSHFHVANRIVNFAEDMPSIYTAQSINLAHGSGNTSPVGIEGHILLDYSATIQLSNSSAPKGANETGEVSVRLAGEPNVDWVTGAIVATNSGHASQLALFTHYTLDGEGDIQLRRVSNNIVIYFAGVPAEPGYNDYIIYNNTSGGFTLLEGATNWQFSNHDMENIISALDFRTQHFAQQTGNYMFTLRFGRTDSEWLNIGDQTVFFINGMLGFYMLGNIRGSSSEGVVVFHGHLWGYSGVIISCNITSEGSGLALASNGAWLHFARGTIQNTGTGGAYSDKSGHWDGMWWGGWEYAPYTHVGSNLPVSFLSNSATVPTVYISGLLYLYGKNVTIKNTALGGTALHMQGGADISLDYYNNRYYGNGSYEDQMSRLYSNGISPYMFAIIDNAVSAELPHGLILIEGCTGILIPIGGDVRVMVGDPRRVSGSITIRSNGIGSAVENHGVFLLKDPNVVPPSMGPRNWGGGGEYQVTDFNPNVQVLVTSSGDYTIFSTGYMLIPAYSNVQIVNSGTGYAIYGWEPDPDFYDYHGNWYWWGNLYYEAGMIDIFAESVAYTLGYENDYGEWTILYLIQEVTLGQNITGKISVYAEHFRAQLSDGWGGHRDEHGNWTNLYAPAHFPSSFPITLSGEFGIDWHEGSRVMWWGAPYANEVLLTNRGFIASPGRSYEDMDDLVATSYIPLGIYTITQSGNYFMVMGERLGGAPYLVAYDGDLNFAFGEIQYDARNLTEITINFGLLGSPLNIGARGNITLSGAWPKTNFAGTLDASFNGYLFSYGSGVNIATTANIANASGGVFNQTGGSLSIEGGNITAVGRAVNATGGMVYMSGNPQIQGRINAGIAGIDASGLVPTTTRLYVVESENAVPGNVMIINGAQWARNFAFASNGYFFAVGTGIHENHLVVSDIATKLYAYEITKSGNTYIATGYRSDGARYVVDNGVADSVQSAVDAIKVDAEGNNLSITFVDFSEVLDINTNLVTLNNAIGTWGTITLAGAIISNVNGGSDSAVIIIEDGVSVQSFLDITNSGNAYAFRNNGAGTLTITTGSVLNTGTGSVIGNYGGGTLAIGGGTVNSSTKEAIISTGGIVDIFGTTSQVVGKGEAVLLVSNTALKLNGGLVTNASGANDYAVKLTDNQSSLTIGGSPKLVGNLGAYPEQITVINTFNPTSVYSVVPQGSYQTDWNVGDIYVFGGANFLLNFMLENEEGLSLNKQGNNLIVSTESPAIYRYRIVNGVYPLYEVYGFYANNQEFLMSNSLPGIPEALNLINSDANGANVEIIFGKGGSDILDMRAPSIQSPFNVAFNNDNGVWGNITLLGSAFKYARPIILDGVTVVSRANISKHEYDMGVFELFDDVTFTIESGLLESWADIVYFSGSRSTLNVTGGELICYSGTNGYAINMSSVESHNIVNIYGENTKIIGASAISISGEGSTVNVYGGELISRRFSVIDQGCYTTLNVYDGSILAEHGWNGVLWGCCYSVINIYGGLLENLNPVDDDYNYNPIVDDIHSSIWMQGAEFNIYGGTINALVYAKYCHFGWCCDSVDAIVTLGGTPEVNRTIILVSGSVANVVTSGANAFNPQGNIYTLEVRGGRAGDIVVLNGANFLSRFNLIKSSFTLEVIGNNIVLSNSAPKTYEYTIVEENRGGNIGFAVYGERVNGAIYEVIFTSVIADAINAIRSDASGFDCNITFGKDGETLDIGSASAVFSNAGISTWGTIYLFGSLSAGVTSANSATLRIETDAVVLSWATVESYAVGNAVQHMGADILYIRGTVINSAGGRSAVNMSSGTLEFEEAVVTSNGSSATVANLGSGRLVIENGNLIENTGTGSAVQGSDTGLIFMDRISTIHGNISVFVNTLHVRVFNPAVNDKFYIDLRGNLGEDFVTGDSVVIGGANYFDNFYSANQSNYWFALGEGAKINDIVVGGYKTYEYIISNVGAGSYKVESALSNGSRFQIAFGLCIQESLMTIRHDAESYDVKITFENVDLGNSSVTISDYDFMGYTGTWGVISIYGDITSEGSTATVITEDEVIVKSFANISNTSDNGKAVLHGSAQMLAIAGGEINGSVSALITAGILALTNTPVINGDIAVFSSQLDVSAVGAFVPQSNQYTVHLLGNFSTGSVAVAGAGNFLSNFVLSDSLAETYRIVRGTGTNSNHLVLAGFISEIHITNVVAPVGGQTPNFTSALPAHSSYSVVETSWAPVAGSFGYGTVYTVRVTVSASANYSFADIIGFATINGSVAEVTYNLNGTITLALSFAKTACAPCDCCGFHFGELCGEEDCEFTKACNCRFCDCCGKCQRHADPEECCCDRCYCYFCACGVCLECDWCEHSCTHCADEGCCWCDWENCGVCYCYLYGEEGNIRCWGCTVHDIFCENCCEACECTTCDNCNAWCLCPCGGCSKCGDCTCDCEHCGDQGCCWCEWDICYGCYCCSICLIHESCDCEVCGYCWQCGWCGYECDCPCKLCGYEGCCVCDSENCKRFPCPCPDCDHCGFHVDCCGYSSCSCRDCGCEFCGCGACYLHDEPCDCECWNCGDIGCCYCEDTCYGCWCSIWGEGFPCSNCCVPHGLCDCVACGECGVCLCACGACPNCDGCEHNCQFCEDEGCCWCEYWLCYGCWCCGNCETHKPCKCYWCGCNNCTQCQEHHFCICVVCGCGMCSFHDGGCDCECKNCGDIFGGCCVCDPDNCFIYSCPCPECHYCVAHKSVCPPGYCSGGWCEWCCVYGVGKQTCDCWWCNTCGECGIHGDCQSYRCEDCFCPSGWICSKTGSCFCGYCDDCEWCLCSCEHSECYINECRGCCKCEWWNCGHCYCGTCGCANHTNAKCVCTYCPCSQCGRCEVHEYCRCVACYCGNCLFHDGDDCGCGCKHCADEGCCVCESDYCKIYKDCPCGCNYCFVHPPYCGCWDSPHCSCNKIINGCWCWYCACGACMECDPCEHWCDNCADIGCCYCESWNCIYCDYYYDNENCVCCPCVHNGHNNQCDGENRCSFHFPPCDCELCTLCGFCICVVCGECMDCGDCCGVGCVHCEDNGCCLCSECSTWCWCCYICEAHLGGCICYYCDCCGVCLNCFACKCEVCRCGLCAYHDGGCDCECKNCGHWYLGCCVCKPETCKKKTDCPCPDCDWCYTHFHRYWCGCNPKDCPHYCCPGCAEEQNVIYECECWFCLACGACWEHGGCEHTCPYCGDQDGGCCHCDWDNCDWCPCSFCWNCTEHDNPCDCCFPCKCTICTDCYNGCLCACGACPHCEGCEDCDCGYCGDEGCCFCDYLRWECYYCDCCSVCRVHSNMPWNPCNCTICDECDYCTVHSFCRCFCELCDSQGCCECRDRDCDWCWCERCEKCYVHDISCVCWFCYNCGYCMVHFPWFCFCECNFCDGSGCCACDSGNCQIYDCVCEDCNHCLTHACCCYSEYCECWFCEQCGECFIHDDCGHCQYCEGEGCCLCESEKCFHCACYNSYQYNGCEACSFHQICYCETCTLCDFCLCECGACLKCGDCEHRCPRCLDLGCCFCDFWACNRCSCCDGCLNHGRPHPHPCNCDSCDCCGGCVKHKQCTCEVCPCCDSCKPHVYWCNCDICDNCSTCNYCDWCDCCNLCANEGCCECERWRCRWTCDCCWYCARHDKEPCGCVMCYGCWNCQLCDGACDCPCKGCGDGSGCCLCESKYCYFIDCPCPECHACFWHHNGYNEYNFGCWCWFCVSCGGCAIRSHILDCNCACDHCEGEGCCHCDQSNCKPCSCDWCNGCRNHKDYFPDFYYKECKCVICDECDNCVCPACGECYNAGFCDSSACECEYSCRLCKDEGCCKCSWWDCVKCRCNQSHYTSYCRHCITHNANPCDCDNNICDCCGVCTIHMICPCEACADCDSECFRHDGCKYCPCCDTCANVGCACEICPCCTVCQVDSSCDCSICRCGACLTCYECECCEYCGGDGCCWCDWDNCDYCRRCCWNCSTHEMPDCGCVVCGCWNCELHDGGCDCECKNCGDYWRGCCVCDPDNCSIYICACPDCNWCHTHDWNSCYCWYCACGACTSCDPCEHWCSCGDIGCCHCEGGCSYCQCGWCWSCSKHMGACGCCLPCNCDICEVCDWCLCPCGGCPGCGTCPQDHKCFNCADDPNGCCACDWDNCDRCACDKCEKCFCKGCQFRCKTHSGECSCVICYCGVCQTHERECVCKCKLCGDWGCCVCEPLECLVFNCPCEECRYCRHHPDNTQGYYERCRCEFCWICGECAWHNGCEHKETCIYCGGEGCCISGVRCDSRPCRYCPPGCHKSWGYYNCRTHNPNINSCDTCDWCLCTVCGGCQNCGTCNHECKHCEDEGCCFCADWWECDYCPCVGCNVCRAHAIDYHYVFYGYKIECECTYCACCLARCDFCDSTRYRCSTHFTCACITCACGACTVHNPCECPCNECGEIGCCVCESGNCVICKCDNCTTHKSCECTCDCEDEETCCDCDSGNCVICECDNCTTHESCECGCDCDGDETCCECDEVNCKECVCCEACVTHEPCDCHFCACEACLECDAC
ncbi:MAG: hypothetical protein FWD49_01555, partial [Firmicutes bacterium]|nr:hypothetical protein [Bacillota bacterium]